MTVGEMDGVSYSRQQRFNWPRKSLSFCHAESIAWGANNFKQRNDLQRS
jgi:hypothetical protein